jgi:hypothetical protein
MTEKKFKQVCHCENCGNEAEMMVTCQLVPQEDEKELEKKKLKPRDEKSEGGTPAQTVCTTCGNEADMWLDES